MSNRDTENKKQFAAALRKLMDAMGWHASELARQAGLPRDSISVYLNAKSLPTPKNLRALAEALQVSPEELLPKTSNVPHPFSEPVSEMRLVAGTPNAAWLRIDRLVSVKTAAKIMELIGSDGTEAQQ
jgi:transcriptional regulator with XRE-family HTH domain